ncbi:MAG: 1-acyl-sn-glycerol-3-phosphate acyltransferase [Bacilli bacterium]|nr:1-acyl-sn-glycerol-3-phosphate acyltransferase [Bacilli bacterium]
MKKKVVYYNDPLNDDFAGTNIKRKPLPKNYRFHHTNPIYRFLTSVFYYTLAWPAIFLYLKIGFHTKVVGKKNIRSLKKGGFFVYGNHTHYIDAMTAQIYASRGRRTYIAADQDVTSLPFLRGLVSALGVIPVPLNPDESAKFKDAIAFHISKKHVISIFPEAHIWPYCTHIRPFGDASFVYPCELNRPAVAMVMTYRKRKIFKNRKPLHTLHVSRPFYPDMKLSLPERKAALRNHIYDYFLDITSEDGNIEWIAYRKAENKVD